VLHVERAVSRLVLTVHTDADRRVSHSHGLTLTARCRMLPSSAATRRGPVSLVPRGGTPERRPA